MTDSRILKRPLPAMMVLGALALGGCSGTNVGSSWQCPLAQGGTCDSVAAADPAVPRAAPVPQTASAPDAASADGMTIREPLYRARGGRPEPVAEPCEAGCDFDPFGWLTRLFATEDSEGEDEFRPADAGPMKIAPGAGAAPSRTRGADPAIESAIDVPILADEPEPGDDGLRTEEVVARIWIAPFVDANGVYREGSHVRVVLEPAGWRLP